MYDHWKIITDNINTMKTRLWEYYRLQNCDDLP